MKIPKAFYQRLDELEKAIPKLIDHSIALFFDANKMAQFFSMEGKDQGFYSVSRQHGESEVAFLKRAKAQATLKFPKAEIVVCPYEFEPDDQSEDDADDDAISPAMRRLNEQQRRLKNDRAARRASEENSPKKY